MPMVSCGSPGTQLPDDFSFYFNFALPLLAGSQESPDDTQNVKDLAGAAECCSLVATAVRQLRSCEKKLGEYCLSAEQNPTAAVCDDGSRGQCAAHHRIAFLLGKEPYALTVPRDDASKDLTDSAEVSVGSDPENGLSDDALGASDTQSQSPRTQSDNDSEGTEDDAATQQAQRGGLEATYSQFILSTCHSDYCADCPIAIAVLAFRLFQRYLARYSAEEVLRLCKCTRRLSQHFAPCVVRECFALAGNYLQDGQQRPVSALTLHVLQTLQFDVPEVTPLDYCGLLLDPRLKGALLPHDTDLPSISHYFTQSVLVLFSIPSFSALASSELAALALLRAVSVASKQCLDAQVDSIFSAHGFVTLASHWHVASRALTQVA